MAAPDIARHLLPDVLVIIYLFASGQVAGGADYQITAAHPAMANSQTLNFVFCRPSWVEGAKIQLCSSRTVLTNSKVSSLQ